MIEILHKVFEYYGFVGKAIENGYFYHRNQDEYWIVVNYDVHSIVDKQAEYYEMCRKLCSDDELGKNLSMLVLWETGGTIPKEILRKTKIGIEENPFYFKKYVLAYSNEESNQLVEQIGHVNPVEFILNSIVKKNIFDVYKLDPYDFSWQSLLYRVTIKVPFIKIKMNESANLQSLVGQNNIMLQDKGLKDYDDSIGKIIDDLSIASIENMSAIDLCEKLSKAEG